MGRGSPHADAAWDHLMCVAFELRTCLMEATARVSRGDVITQDSQQRLVHLLASFRLGLEQLRRSGMQCGDCGECKSLADLCAWAVRALEHIRVFGHAQRLLAGRPRWPSPPGAQRGVMTETVPLQQTGERSPLPLPPQLMEVGNESPVSDLSELCDLSADAGGRSRAVAGNDNSHPREEIEPEQEAAEPAVLGCDHVLRVLHQALVMPRKFPHLFRGIRRPWRFLLLYGPPGTGKTMIAEFAATQVRATFMRISSGDILSKWVGESERLIRETFAKAAACDRCVLFIDEVDSLCAARGDGEVESTRRVKTELLIRMQELASRSSLRRTTLFIAATNLPWELDPAFRRRFDQLLYVGLPDTAARRAMLSAALEGIDHHVSPSELDDLSLRLEGFSGSDIANVMRHAAMAPVERWMQCGGPEQQVEEEEGRSAGAPVGVDLCCRLTVTATDVLTGMKTYPATVSRAYVEKYESFRL